MFKHKIIRLLYSVFPVICYLATFRLDELGMAHFRKFVSSQDINKMYRVGFTRIVRWKLFERGVNLCVPLSIRCLPSGIFYISVDLCVPLSIRFLPSGIFYISVDLSVPLSIRCLPSGIFYISVDLCVPLSIRCLPSGIFYITRALCSSLY